MELDEIRSAYSSGVFRFRDHAQRQMAQRAIRADEVGHVLDEGVIIEEYPQHIYGRCCLIYGRTLSGRHLYVVLAPPPAAWIITVYEPDPERWIDYRIRRVEE